MEFFNSHSLLTSSTAPQLDSSSSPLPAALLSAVVSRRDARVARVNQPRRNLLRLGYAQKAAFKPLNDAKQVTDSYDYYKSQILVSTHFRLCKSVSAVESLLGCARDSLSVSSAHYCFAVRQCAALGDFASGWRLFDTAKRELYVSTHLFRVGVWLCSLQCDKRHYVERAVALLNEMGSFDCVPDTAILNTLLRMCVSSGHYALGLRLCRELTTDWNKQLADGQSADADSSETSSLSKKSKSETSGNIQHPFADSSEMSRFQPVFKDVGTRNLLMRLWFLHTGDAFYVERFAKRLLAPKRDVSKNDANADGSDANTEAIESQSVLHNTESYTTAMTVLSDALRSRLKSALTKAHARSAEGRRQIESSASARFEARRMEVKQKRRQEFEAEKHKGKRKQKDASAENEKGTTKAKLYDDSSAHSRPPLVKESKEWRKQIGETQATIDALLSHYLEAPLSAEDTDATLCYVFGRYMDCKAEAGDVWTCVDCLNRFISDVPATVSSAQQENEASDRNEVGLQPTIEMFSSVLKALTRFPEMAKYWKRSPFDTKPTAAMQYIAEMEVEEEYKFDAVSGSGEAVDGRREFEEESETAKEHSQSDGSSANDSSSNPSEGALWRVVEWLLSEMQRCAVVRDPIVYGMLFHLCSDALSSAECGSQPCSTRRLFAFYIAMLRQSGKLEGVSTPLPKGMAVESDSGGEGRSRMPTPIGDEQMRSFLQSAVRCLHHDKWDNAERLHLLRWFSAELQRMSIAPSSMTSKVLNKHFTKYFAKVQRAETGHDVSYRDKKRIVQSIEHDSVHLERISNFRKKRAYRKEGGLS